MAAFADALMVELRSGAVAAVMDPVVFLYGGGENRTNVFLFRGHFERQIPLCTECICAPCTQSRPPERKWIDTTADELIGFVTGSTTARTDCTTITKDLHMVVYVIPDDVIQAAVRVWKAAPAPPQRNRRVRCRKR